jgi:hypothetical protein
MRKSASVALKPAVEAMEARALLSATTAVVSVLNPRIGVTGEGPGRFTFGETPNLVQVVVVSQAGAHPFAPLTQLVPGTIRIDGIAGAGKVYIQALPMDVNSDGIPDAIVSVMTNGSIQFPAGPGYLTITGTLKHTTAVWAAAAPIDVFGGPTAGGGAGGGFAQYQGYIIVTNQTARTVYESLNQNAPPGGTPAPDPGNYFPVTPFVPYETYTGPGQPSQLVIQANFSLSPSGTKPFPVVWYAGAMTVSTFTPPSIIRWYLHLNKSTSQFYINNTP